ncbi:MAG: hypothetical protein AAB691_02215 [Patescibacteria group bacterium]
MKTFKKISLVAFLLVVVVFGFFPHFADARRDESNICFGVGDVVIDLNLPCLFGGKVCLDADLANECQRLGGRWSAVMPQYIGPGDTNGPVEDVETFLDLLVWFIKFFQIVFWVLTVGFGLYAAYLYLFAAGSSEKAAQARRVLGYTVIAAVVSVIAYSIPSVIDSFLAG